MDKLTATVETPNASRYLQQLFKHWSHRFETEFTPERGTLSFSDDQRLAATASDSALTLVVEAPGDKVEGLAKVVEEHLLRFAFREDLTVSWA
ncbi:DUF2218 domain-containing protein [Psychromarinibacter sp. C21-152]|uniref:DUF2218 domain-containing protein n=1 Tax=Psychromarinibacter sediminicola TaxID=3033385 RepID=A0AAE3TBG8_9RHOB|nr:DUF2218 domain-containing protein [Psychromarinibacter sediminicola]MDF0603848.1 DUF2218 domain-containing protein [Psychromarinibacter sediminicola]